MRQWVALDLDPAAFWLQSPASFGAAMRGRIEARREAHELALYGAWQAERFARTDRLKPLADYLREGRKPAPAKQAERQAPRSMLAAFADLAAAGAPIRIERVS